MRGGEGKTRVRRCLRSLSVVVSGGEIEAVAAATDYGCRTMKRARRVAKVDASRLDFIVTIF